MAKRRKKRAVAMATRRKISRALKAYHRHKQQKEQQRRKKISATLRARAAARKPKEPLQEFIRPSVKEPERQSLGDFIIQTLNVMSAERKPAAFELPEGRQAGGFDMKDQHPDLPRRFEHNQQVSVEAHYVYFTDEGELQENTVTLFFNSGANDEEFWHNYHAAIRDELETETADIEGGYQDFSVFVARMA